MLTGASASVTGVGDLERLGLLRGVWAEVMGAPAPLAVPPYTPGWAEETGAETMLDAFRALAVEIPRTEARPGDALLFRLRRRGPAKHCAIVAPEDRIVHAYSGHAVAETALPEPWRGRVAAAFAFPAD